MNTQQLRNLTLGLLAGLVLPLAATATELDGEAPGVRSGERYELTEEARKGLQDAYTTFAANQREVLSLPAEPNRIAIDAVSKVPADAATAARIELPVIAVYQATP
jgi:hypothetical protein